jgi:uncharacterized membrane protein
MRELLVVASGHAVTIIYWMALLVVVIGTIEAFVSALRASVAPLKLHQRGDVWLRYARWLVAALTFQLAADIIETAISTSWESVGRIAAIAVVRTFLNFFLERDVREARRQRQEEVA